MRKIVTWVLTVLLALAFVGAGLAKLTGAPMMVQEFTTFGLPLWFMYVTGSLELVAAVGLLVPRTAGFAAALIVCIMLGALLAHLTHGQVAMIGAPVVLLLIAIAVGTLRGWGVSSRLALRAAA
jgi:uncharacterized membrane protein YphA (DoxX/SURF4 family)